MFLFFLLKIIKIVEHVFKKRLFHTASQNLIRFSNQPCRDYLSNYKAPVLRICCLCVCVCGNQLETIN